MHLASAYTQRREGLTTDSPPRPRRLRAWGGRRCKRRRQQCNSIHVWVCMLGQHRLWDEIVGPTLMVLLSEGLGFLYEIPWLISTTLLWTPLLRGLHLVNFSHPNSCINCRLAVMRIRSCATPPELRCRSTPAALFSDLDSQISPYGSPQ